MTLPPPVLPKEKRRAFAWEVIPVLLLAALVWFLMYVAFRAAQFGWTASNLPQERAAARREKIPLSPADLRRRPPVPAAQNAAPLYRRIAAALNRRAINDDEKALDALRKPTRTETDREAARRVLARRKPLLDLAERAAALPHCDFQRPYEKGAAVEFPEYVALRHAARLLAAQATLESDADQPQKAFATVAVGARIATHVGEDTTLITMLVQIAIRALMDRTYHTVLRAHYDKPGIVALAEQTERAFGAKPDLLHALGGEVVLATATCEQMRTGILPRSEDDAGGLPPKSPAWVVNGWEANLLSSWREVFRNLRRVGNADPLAQYTILQAKGRAFKSAGGNLDNVIAALSFPVFDNAPLKIAHEDMQRQLRKTAVVLVAYRQKTGRYPERLAELPVPPTPDLFTGKPFIYRRKDDGFLLYSVGTNFKDDGGRAKSTRVSGPDDTDIVVNYAD